MSEIDKIETEIGSTLHSVEPMLSAVGITLPSKAEAEKEAGEIATTWALTFAGTFAVLAKPALHATSLGTAKTLVVSAAIAGAAAGGRAVKPLIAKALGSMRNRKSAAVAAAVAAANAAATTPPAAS